MKYIKSREYSKKNSSYLLGKIPYENFRNYSFQKVMEIDPFDSLRIAFQTFDKDKEGVIPSDRFKKWITTIGNFLNEKEAKELIKMGDPGNKGFIVYEDLIGILLN